MLSEDRSETSCFLWSSAADPQGEGREGKGAGRAEPLCVQVGVCEVCDVGCAGDPEVKAAVCC